MASERDVLEALRRPLPEADVQWRVSRSGVNDKGSWAVLVCYLDARAVMRRLDDVCGLRWSSKLERHPIVRVDDDGRRRSDSSAWVSTISITLSDGLVISRSDAADETDIESTKGGASDALKRAGVQFGIGRYLYDLDEEWVRGAAGYAPREQRHLYIEWATGRGSDRKPWHARLPDLPDWARP